MNSFEDWLNRKPKGPAPRRPIARTTRVKRVSNRRKREAPTYAKASAEYLKDHPRCEIGPIIKSGGFQVRCLGVATHCHHTRGRGRFLCDKTTFLASCSGECHPEWVHFSHKAEAVKLGLIIYGRIV